MLPTYEFDFTLQLTQFFFWMMRSLRNVLSLCLPTEAKNCQCNELTMCHDRIDMEAGASRYPVFCVYPSP